MKSRINWVVASLLTWALFAQTPSSSKDASQNENPPVKSVGSGAYEIGEVRLNKIASKVSFPGFVNMTNLVVEYAIVGAQGKRHESVLATKVPPYHIHLAALLLGATNRIEKTQSGQPLSGHPIHIWVSWNSGEIELKIPLENMVRQGSEGPPMNRGVWLYNGSRVIEGTFIAQRDESIVAIMHDPDALINNPRPGRENDDIWFVNAETVPPINTPVQIILDFDPTR